MLSLGLSVADELAYRRALAGAYDFKTTILITDLEHKVISDVSHLLIGGGLSAEAVEAEPGDEDVAVQQTYSCELLDPGRTIGFDSGSPADAAIYLDRMVKVVTSVRVVELGRWIDCPIFWGPVTKFDRDNDLVSVECQSKENLALRPANKAKTYSGVKVTAASAMLLAAGEDAKHIDFPTDTSKLSKNIVFTRQTKPWAQAWLLAQTLLKTLFYDGRGVARMADNSSRPCFTFDGSNVSAVPQTTNDSAGLVNGVCVIGSKASYTYTAYALAGHPNSPQALKRNGVNSDLILFIEDSDLNSQAKVKARAIKELADLMRTVGDTTLEVFPVWNLEIGDLVLVDLPEYAGEIRVQSFTKPSTHADNMPIGYTRKTTTPSLANIRRP